MKVTNIKAEFLILSDDFLPDDITEKLSIEPSFKWKVGEKINSEKHNRVYKSSGWEISTGYEESLDINEQLNKILYKIHSCHEVLAQLCLVENIECRFCIVVKIENGQTPAMILSRELIKFASEINAEIEFDLYVNPYLEEM